MTLSDENREILLLHLHQLIEEHADTTANHLQHGRWKQLINYPPNGGMTEAEKAEIAKLEGNEVLKSALRKILAGNTADVFFSFLNVLDGTADPEVASANWTEVMLVDLADEHEANEMLHDRFYETYWNWKAKRRNSNWKLDLQDNE